MRPLTLYLQSTLDGFIADANNSLDWMLPDTSMPGDEALPQQWDTAIIGMGGYKQMSEYWPTAAENPEATDIDKAFATHINAMEKLVFSSKKRDPSELTWNHSTPVQVTDDASVRKTLEEIQQRPGKGIVVFGGVRIAQTLARLDLIDEYLLVLHPVALGEGKALFENLPHPLKLELVDTARNKSGAVRVHYRRATSPS
jgi:dihydrofolate reductase